MGGPTDRARLTLAYARTRGSSTGAADATPSDHYHRPPDQPDGRPFMRVRDLAAAMEAVAPLELAEPWDNVGLLAGSAEWQLGGPVLLAIDLTRAVLAEALAAKPSAVVAYHPPIWEGVK